MNLGKEVFVYAAIGIGIGLMWIIDSTKTKRRPPDRIPLLPNEPPPPKNSCTEIPTLTGVPCEILNECSIIGPKFPEAIVKGWKFVANISLNPKCDPSSPGKYWLDSWTLTPPPECPNPNPIKVPQDYPLIQFSCLK